MVKFLIDVNLPRYFSLWNHVEYIHQIDIDDKMLDNVIWEYAKTNDLTIITKDSDFSNKILFNKPPPKVIHIRVGNMKIKDFQAMMFKVWEDVLTLNKDHKLVNVFLERIEAIE